MPGWLSDATVAASRWNRWRKLVSLEYCSARTLIAAGVSRRGWVERYTTPMAPRPSSASIGYRASCVVVTVSGGNAVCGTAPVKLPNKGWRAVAPALAEDAQRQVKRDPEVGLVDNLADPQIARQAAQDVGILATQRVVRSQPGNRVADRVAGVLHEVGAERAYRVVPGGVASRLQSLGRRLEVIAPWPQPAAFHHSKSEGERHRTFDSRNADLAVSLRRVAIACGEHPTGQVDRQAHRGSRRDAGGVAC